MASIYNYILLKGGLQYVQLRVQSSPATLKQEAASSQRLSPPPHPPRQPSVS